MFADRIEAGRALALKLEPYQRCKDGVILALPRGGVPVAYEVARALELPLDILVVRKLGVPSHPELAMGAIASGGAIDVNQDVIEMAGVTEAQVQAVLARERAELDRRERAYRSWRPPLDLRGAIVIVIDDGMATGASLRAGLSAVRTLKPAKLVAAVPVAPADAAERMSDIADEFVSVLSPSPFDFRSVGQFYRSFRQTTDDEVRSLLERAQSVMP